MLNALRISAPFALFITGAAAKEMRCAMLKRRALLAPILSRLAPMSLWTGAVAGLKLPLVSTASAAAPLLGLTHIDPGYRHYDKLVTGGDVVSLRDARLKWYDIARPEAPVEPHVRCLARDFLDAEAATRDWHLDRELGFAMLHLCGTEFYFLIVCTWRGSNELWESVYFKETAATPGFSLFPRERRHKPTYCVWEMGVVSHETAAWKWFLRSPRAAADEDAYLGKAYAGLV